MGPLPAQAKLLQIHLRLRPTAMAAFRAVLPDEAIADYCQREGVDFRNRFFTPLLTFWTFVGQCMDPDHSCRSAVARTLNWWRRGRAPGQRSERKPEEHSHDTGAYCRARERLPEGLVATMGRRVADDLEARVPESQRMWGRNVYLVDGTCLSMPDTEDLAKEFGRSGGGQRGSKQSLFPIGRLVAVISLATGALVDMAIGAYRESEHALFRALAEQARWLRGAIIVGDRLYGSLPNLMALVAHGADIISRPYGRRKVDLRQGKQLGPGDRLVQWNCDPKGRNPDCAVALRLIEVRSLRRGFRPQRLVLVTTLTDATRYRAEDIANLYLRRWEIEVDMRHIKSVMAMEVLRGKTPDIVRKEIWATMAAYNLVRAVMWEAAATHDFPPSGLEFQRHPPAPQYLRAEHRRRPILRIGPPSA